MKTFFIAFFFGLLSSLALTRLARYLGKRLEFTDVAWGRKLHSGSIPILGGISIAFSFFITVSTVYLLNHLFQEGLRADHRVSALLIGGALVVALGLWDDLRQVRVRYKLLAQLLIATLTFFLGIQIRVIWLPFLGELEMGVFALPVTIFWILGFMNAINFIDGVDGLCAGVSLIAALTMMLVSAFGGGLVLPLLAAALAGSILGFLWFNFNPATIFLGDNGSYFLGYSLATISILGAQKASLSVAVLTPLLAIGMPILDTLVAIIRRYANERSIFAPDRGHFHHRLLNRGYSVRKVVGIIYAISAVLAVAGIVTVLGRELESGLALAVAVTVIFYVIHLTGAWRAIEGVDNYRDQSLPESKSDILREMLPDFYRMILTGCEEPLSINRALADLAERIDLVELEVVLNDKNGKPIPWRWEKERSTPPPKYAPLVSGQYELVRGGESVGGMKLSYYSELAKVDRCTDLLLRLTAEIISLSDNRLMVNQDDIEEK